MVDAGAEARMNELLRELAVAWRALSAYPAGHPAVAGALSKGHAAATALLAEAGPVDVGAARDALLWKDRRLEAPPAVHLARLLRRRSAAGFHLDRGVTVGELETFLRALTLDPRRAHAAGSLSAELAAAGLLRLRVADLDLSGLALVEADEEADAPDAGSLADRLVERLVGRGVLAASARARWAAAGKSTADLLRLLFDGGGAGNAAGAFASAVEGVAQELCAAPVGDNAAAAADLVGRLQGDGRARFVRAIAAEVARRDLSPEAIDLVCAALPPGAAAEIRRALATTGPGAEEESPHDSAPPRLPPSQLAMLRRAFAEQDVDAFREAEAPVAELAEVLELPPDGAAAPPSAAARKVAEELAADATADATPFLVELSGNEALPAFSLSSLLRRIEAGFVRLLTQGRVVEADAIAARIRDRASGEGEGAVAAHASLERMSDEKAMEALVASLPGLPEPELDAVPALVTRLEPGAVAHLLDQLSLTDDRRVRLRLLGLLPRLGPTIARSAEARLSDARWYVVRNMLLLLRRVGDVRSVPAVRQCASHPDLRVRLEAIHNLFAFDRRVPAELLRKALHDRDPRQAAAAMDLAGQYEIAEAVEPILDLLLAWDPFGRRREVRLKAIRALGAIGDPAALARLDHYRRRRSFLAPPLEERRELYKTLGEYPEEWRGPWVESGLRSPDPEIRRICGSLAAPAGRNP